MPFPSSNYTRTGRDGRVFLAAAGLSPATEIARITEWSFNFTLATSSEWGDSYSEGFENRSAGRRDATADTEGKYDTGEEVWDLFQPGDVLALNLSGARSTTGFYGLRIGLPRALCNDFSLTVDIDSSEVIGWEASWGADGPFFFEGDEIVSDHYPGFFE